MSNVKQIMLAHTMYAQDYDEMFAPSGGASHDPDHPENWPNRIEPYLKNEQILVCPSNRGQWPHSYYNYDYTMRLDNNGIALSTIDRPAEFWLVADGARNYAYPGNHSSWPFANTYAQYSEYGYVANESSWDSYSHNNMLNWGFADGHVKLMGPAAIKKLPNG